MSSLLTPTPHASLRPRPPWWHWPLPAVAVWAAAWAAHAWLRPAVGPVAAVGLALALALGLAQFQAGRWRRAIVVGGFPLMLAAAALPPWAWLPPMALLLLLYPPRAWADAPVFPTPPGALDRLAPRLPLAPGARVLDAGCGAGAGLRALARAWPHARVEGIEWSRPLAWWARRQGAAARVDRGDMWAPGAWQGVSLVYLFQRPESMARAWAKACAEMAPGAWLVSLEFEVPGRPADLHEALPGGRTVRAWRIPPQPRRAGADNPR